MVLSDLSKGFTRKGFWCRVGNSRLEQRVYTREQKTGKSKGLPNFETVIVVRDLQYNDVDSDNQFLW